MKHFTVLLPLFFCVLTVTGCSGNVQVTGKVTFPDGEPLSTGQVVFENEKVSAMGKLSEDGSYTLGTDKEKNGIPKGNYRVYITGAVTYGEAPQIPAAGGGYNPSGNSALLPSSISLIDRKYRSAETSELVVDVKGGMNYDITVGRP